MISYYLTQLKAQLLRRAQRDFAEEYNKQITPYTSKTFFYFHIMDGVKYVHLPSLEAVYSNGDTFCTDLLPECCYLQKQIEPVDIASFLTSYNGDLLPLKLHQNKSFIAYQTVRGQALTQVNIHEFYRLKEKSRHCALTPFYNSMAYNLVKADDSDDVFLVDVKHFEEKDNKPFFIYMFNRENGINDLYVEQLTNTILDHLRIDYPVDYAKIHIMSRE